MRDFTAEYNTMKNYFALGIFPLSEVEEGTILLLCLLEILLVVPAITLSLDSRWPRGYDDDDFKKIEEESDKNLVYLCVLQTLRR